MHRPVQLSLALLQCLQRAVLLQGDNDGLDLARAGDHLMVSDVSAKAQGILGHATRLPVRLASAGGWIADCIVSRAATRRATPPTSSVSFSSRISTGTSPW